ncbi:hypothetical protein JCM10213_000218 [Rhodosporidiobolus nylandii]
MRPSTAAPALLFSFLAPSLAAASWWSGDRASQLRFDRIPSLREGADAANPSVVVAVVDPASPSTSSLVTPSSLSSSSADEDEDEQEDAPNFGQACTYERTFQTCGDYFDEASGLDHGLFCSPSGVCGGKGAVCGASEACDEGLVCNLSSHRCVTATAALLSIEHDRKASRRKAAFAACPEGSQACSSGIGGFECIHVETDDQHCGGCLELGGRDCSAIPHAFATSCRSGSCQVHACVAGFSPNEEGTECVDEMFFA